ncbi:MAG: hypothetical protein EB142_02750 [Actinobacteria bacterium]|nr:hypothetical protein [Actinomycetota bacterium]
MNVGQRKVARDHRILHCGECADCRREREHRKSWYQSNNLLLISAGASEGRKRTKNRADETD